MRKPLYNAVLQNALDADGHGIQNIASENLKQVWISSTARTDGQTGTGTRTDPYDGSTQVKFDTIMRSYFDAGTQDIVFHLSPGQFYSSGYWDYLVGGALSWGLLTGWHIKGAGKNLTKVTQVVGADGVDAGSNGALFSNGAALTYDNQSVEDLWCDCAWFRSGPGGDNSRPHGNFAGVNLYGENNYVKNVKVTGIGWADNECFGILQSGGIGGIHLPHNALCENCEVSGEGNANCTGHAMINLGAQGGNPSPVYAHNGRILNNLFNLPTGGNAGGPPGGFDSGLVSGNTFIAYFHGIFFDTFVSKNIKIIGNNVDALAVDSNGILFNSGASNRQCEDIIISHNVIRSSAGVGFASAMKNCLVATNRILPYPGKNYDYAIYMNDTTVEKISIIDNICESLPINQYLIPSGGANNLYWKGNRTPSGGPILNATSLARVMQDTSDDTPLTLFVSQAYGNATTATRLKSSMPFPTINAAIAAASSGDTIDVMDGTFNERLTSKSGVTVRFRPQAKLVSTDVYGGCVNGLTSGTFTVYHEHTPMVCSGVDSIGILANISGCVLKIHGGVTNSAGATNPYGVVSVGGSTIEIWGDVVADSGIGIRITGGTTTIRGNVTGSANYAIGGSTGGTVKVIGGTISGHGLNGAVEIDAANAQVVFDQCTIVQTTGASKPAISIAASGTLKPVFRNCILVSDFGATQSIAVGAAQGVRLYGDLLANYGPNPPTSVTFEGPGSYAVVTPLVQI